MRQVFGIVRYNFFGFLRNPKVIFIFLLEFVLSFLLTGRIMVVMETYDTPVQAMPCKAAVVIEGNEIYIPISQAQDLCREIGEPSEISKVYLKINGKNNLENAKKILSGI